MLNKKEKLILKFTMTKEVNEYISKFKGKKYWLAMVICEAFGNVKGKYTKGNTEIILNGNAKIEPQRQVSILGHNSLTIDFKKPPKGVGLSCEIDSNFLNKKISAKLQFAPRPFIKFKINKK